MTVINLNKHRKTKARTEKQKRAEENRVSFGRTKAEKVKTKLDVEKLSRHVESHKRSNNDNDGQ